MARQKQGNGNGWGHNSVDEFRMKVRKEMERQGIGMAELAKKAGCGLPYLYRVLHGQQSPTLEWCDKINRVLGIQIDFSHKKSG